jgi:DNA-binding NtrC family response regulator
VAQSRPSLLIFEDSGGLSEMLREILSDSYRITCVAEATAAFAALARRRFDVVLLDYFPPGGRGDAVAKQICASGVPLVIMSGDIGFAEAEVAGDHLTLQKPFGMDDMLVVLAQARRASATGKTSAIRTTTIPSTDSMSPGSSF